MSALPRTGTTTRGRFDKFFQSDNTTFNDSAKQFNVQINSYVVSPSSVVFDNTNNDMQYTLQGTGTVTGATSLVKNGSSTLTISNQNNYTGGTTINAGTLAVRRPQPFTGTATLNNGAIAVVQPVSNTAFGWGNGATVNVPTGAGWHDVVHRRHQHVRWHARHAQHIHERHLTGGGVINYLAKNVNQARWLRRSISTRTRRHSPAPSTSVTAARRSRCVLRPRLERQIILQPWQHWHDCGQWNRQLCSSALSRWGGINFERL